MSIAASSASSLDLFVMLLPRLCELYGKDGIPAQPWKDPAIPHFLAMSEEQRSTLVRHLRFQVQALEECFEQCVSLLDSWALLQLYFRAAGLSPVADLGTFTGPTDYVGVYDLRGGIQLLTPNHLQHISYPLEELYCRHWRGLFRREERIEKILVERLFPFIQGKRQNTISNEDIPPHIIYETESPGARIMTVESKAYSPLFQGSAPWGFLAINYGVKPASRLLPRPQGLTW